jgi:hypothetical protein
MHIWEPPGIIRFKKLRNQDPVGIELVLRTWKTSISRSVFPSEANILDMLSKKSLG